MLKFDFLGLKKIKKSIEDGNSSFKNNKNYVIDIFEDFKSEIKDNSDLIDNLKSENEELKKSISLVRGEVRNDIKVLEERLELKKMRLRGLQLPEDEMYRHFNYIIQDWFREQGR